MGLKLRPQRQGRATAREMVRMFQERRKSGMCGYQGRRQAEGWEPWEAGLGEGGF